jgi:hypothetical protein
LVSRARFSRSFRIFHSVSLSMAARSLATASRICCFEWWEIKKISKWKEKKRKKRLLFVISFLSVGLVVFTYKLERKTKNKQTKHSTKGIKGPFHRKAKLFSCRWWNGDFWEA